MLNSMCRILYDRSTQFWSLLLSVLNCLPQKGKGRDLRKGLFWAAHQRFYKGLLIAAKVRRFKINVLGFICKMLKFSVSIKFVQFIGIKHCFVVSNTVADAHAGASSCNLCMNVLCCEI